MQCFINCQIHLLEIFIDESVHDWVCADWAHGRKVTYSKDQQHGLLIWYRLKQIIFIKLNVFSLMLWGTMFARKVFGRHFAMPPPSLKKMKKMKDSPKKAKYINFNQTAEQSKNKSRFLCSTFLAKNLVLSPFCLCFQHWSLAHF